MNKTGKDEARGAAWLRLVGVILQLVVALCSSAVAAENPQVSEIWPGKPPDEPGTIGPERSRMSPGLDRTQVEVTQPTRMITDVTKPSLTIYRPKPDQETGTAIIICPGGGY